MAGCAAAQNPPPPGSVIYTRAPDRLPVRGDFKTVMMQEHDRARAAFGSPRLVWDDALARDAMVYARTMADRRVFQHDPNLQRLGQGENLWMGTKGHFAYREMIGHFIGESRYFRPGTFPDVSTTGNWADVGHYTQMVWPTTTHMGCAITSNRTDDYLVCRYRAPGNIVGVRIAPTR
ncbi:CAP domain-containing protein [Sphingomicrobium flavum]|uniref:CAP domain-containing protein n=1 Tax=Sphingomicrobium flavum TaxID=1229164 RepID=UPI0021AD6BEF|nr:CAP domain-containing protein [Sphingomicrobium flavum]